MQRGRDSHGTRTRLLHACLVAGLVLAPAVGKSEDVATLEVVVTGLKSDRGKVVIALVDSAESYDKEDRAVRSATPGIENGRSSVRFEELPYGTYAVKVYHDENANEKLDTNWTGVMPKESFGFSNDAMGRFGPPDFEAAKFELSQPEQQLEIRIKHP